MAPALRRFGLIPRLYPLLPSRPLDCVSEEVGGALSWSWYFLIDLSCSQQSLLGHCLCDFVPDNC